MQSVFDEPPTYAGSVYSRPIASPSYSRLPRLSELVLRSTQDATVVESQDHLFRSKHILLNLGPRQYGTSISVYGNNDTVEGSLKLSGDLRRNVSSVRVKVDGTVVNSYSERGLVTGASTVDILSMSTDIAAPESGDSAQEQLFSFNFLSNTSGRQSSLPPSAILYQPGVTCIIKYRLKVTVQRRGLRRNESLNVPLIYLPRTFAKGPLLERIPFLSNEEIRSSSVETLRGVKLIRLRPWSKCGTLTCAPVISLLLPSVLSFAAYDTIPLALDVSGSNNDAVLKLLLSTAKIQLIKRTRTWINGGRSSSKHETLAGTAEVVMSDDTKCVCHAAYELHAASHLKQKSWAVEGVADQQYFIRVTIRPPSSAAAHLPNYDCEQLVELTTDTYESPEREIAASGGSPTPALGTLAEASPFDHTTGAGSHLSLMTYR